MEDQRGCFGGEGGGEACESLILYERINAIDIASHIRRSLVSVRKSRTADGFCGLDYGIGHVSVVIAYQFSKLGDRRNISIIST